MASYRPPGNKTDIQDQDFIGSPALEILNDIKRAVYKNEHSKIAILANFVLPILQDADYEQHFCGEQAGNIMLFGRTVRIAKSADCSKQVLLAKDGNKSFCYVLNDSLETLDVITSVDDSGFKRATELFEQAKNRLKLDELQTIVARLIIRIKE